MGTVSVNYLILVISFCIIAFFIGRLTSNERKNNKRLQAELEQSRDEIRDYRSRVTNHFRETARRVNVLTENYRDVYEHLALGAKDLCDKNNAPELMNELKRNPMLREETAEDPVIDQEAVPVQTNAESKIADEDLDTAADPTATENHAESTAPETDPGGGTTESSKTDENSGEDAGFNENVNNEPGIGTDEHIEPDQQSPGQNSSTEPK